MSTWASIRSNVIIPCLPYYYVGVALTAFWINPRMFTISMLVIFGIVVVLCVAATLLPPTDAERRPRARSSRMNREGQEHEECELGPGCPVCKMKEEIVRGLAQRLWEEKMQAQEADRVRTAGGGKRKSGKRR
ncbi:hypothetical protein EUX98_g3297 [Antrodiella citrinella]|uniref:Uncharacterized protein n=1 Tax=Antrodiella citrinella TaxID=2447956 RepID=A0A4V3XIY1_9APHY|nr:hypothetical protein EUX98_g3297 [Antrodiella citrinella]